MGFGVAMQKVSGGARPVLLVPDAEPEAARIAMEGKPDNRRIVIEPSPMPPMFEYLAASIGADYRACLEANRAKCWAVTP